MKYISIEKTEIIKYQETLKIKIFYLKSAKFLKVKKKILRHGLKMKKKNIVKFAVKTF
jgi:hypothetical protein